MRSAIAVLSAAALGFTLTGCGSAHHPITVSSQRSALVRSATPAATTPAVTTPPVTTSAASGPPRSSAGLPRPAHVVVVVFENTAAGEVLGNAQAPYFNELSRDGATFTDAHAITHPSQPNYLALFSGSAQGVTDDSCPQTFATMNLGAELITSRHTFAGYSEDLPAAGSTACSAQSSSAQSSWYARKHNPWIDFSNVPASANLPFTAFPKDLNQLPTVSFVIPNLCHDMHDCSTAVGDAWLRSALGDYAKWAVTHDSLLIVTFDEDDGGSDNRILTLFYGAPVHPGTYAERIDHVSVLRTIEDMYDLGHAGAAAQTRPIRDIWR